MKTSAHRISSASACGDNFRDNYEQVLVSGTNAPVTVRISHKGTLVDGFQDVSVIITGNGFEPDPELRITDAGIIGPDGNRVILHWPGVVGARYNVEASSDLTGGIWTNVSSGIIANSTNLVWTNTLPQRCFYKIRRTR